MPGHCATVSRPTHCHSVASRDLSAVPGVLLSPPQAPTWPRTPVCCCLPASHLKLYPPRLWGLLYARLPPTCPTSCPSDLIAVHSVAMPQGEDLPQRDGNGKANHSNGEGLSHKLCEQLGAGGHWGNQPVRDIVRPKEAAGPGHPPALTSRGQSSPCRDVAHNIHPESMLQADTVRDACGPNELGREDRVRGGRRWQHRRGMVGGGDGETTLGMKRDGRPEAEPSEE